MYQGIGNLPHYNPDADVDPLPSPVVELRALVAEANGVIVSCPEYAGGIPGAFKNALDWLVGGVEMYGKAVAIWRVSSRGESATAALRVVLKMLNAKLVDEHVFSTWPGGNAAQLEDLMQDPTWAAEVRAALARFTSAIAHRV